MGAKKVSGRWRGGRARTELGSRVWARWVGRGLGEWVWKVRERACDMIGLVW